MKSTPFRAKSSIVLLGLIGPLTLFAGCSGSGVPAANNPVVTTRFVESDLVSDIAGKAAVTDPDLTNPWGIAFNPTGFAWIADNKSGKATLYNGTGAKQSLIVNLPTPAGSTGGAATGQVFNSTTDFKLPNGSPALFIFSTEDGTIVGWNGKSGTQAVVAADRSAIPIAGSGAVYKGLAIGSNAAVVSSCSCQIFAADFPSSTAMSSPLERTDGGCRYCALCLDGRPCRRQVRRAG